MHALGDSYNHHLAKSHIHMISSKTHVKGSNIACVYDGAWDQQRHTEETNYGINY